MWSILSLPPPAQGDLIFHVGWTGPWLDHFLEDMHALLDSFLATQDLRYDKLRHHLRNDQFLSLFQLQL